MSEVTELRSAPKPRARNPREWETLNADTRPAAGFRCVRCGCPRVSAREDGDFRWVWACAEYSCRLPVGQAWSPPPKFEPPKVKTYTEPELRRQLQDVIAQRAAAAEQFEKDRRSAAAAEEATQAGRRAMDTAEANLSAARAVAHEAAIKSAAEGRAPSTASLSAARGALQDAMDRLAAVEGAKVSLANEVVMGRETAARLDGEVHRLANAVLATCGAAILADAVALRARLIERARQCAWLARNRLLHGAELSGLIALLDSEPERASEGVAKLTETLAALQLDAATPLPGAG